MPDIFVAVDTTDYSDYYRDLVAKGIINRFSISYVDKNRKQLQKDFPNEDSFLTNFSVTPAMIQEIVEMGQNDSIAPNPEQLEISRKTIEAIVKGIIGRDLFETQTYFKVVNPLLNPIYLRGLEVANDPETYRRLLRGNNE